MKTKPDTLDIIPTLVFASAMILIGAANSRAADGAWTNDFDGLWSETTNWLDGVIADGAGSTATFSNDLLSTVLVNMDSARTLGNLTFSPVGVFTLTNNGVDDVNILTLQGPSKPVISVPPGVNATISRTVLAGTNGFVLDGGGTLTLVKAGNDTVAYDPTNTWSGNVVLNNGTLQVRGSGTGAGTLIPADISALSGIDSFTFYNGSTLDLVSAANTSPNYGYMNADLIVPDGQTGSLLIPGRWSGTGGNGGSGMNGTLTGGGILNFEGRYLRGNFAGDWSGFTGRINITEVQQDANPAEFRFGNSNGFPNAEINLTGTPTGDAARAFYYPTPGGVVVIRIGALMGDNTAFSLRGGNGGGTVVEYRVGSLRTAPSAFPDIFSGFLEDGSGLRFVKEGAGTLAIGGDCTHSGGTTISNGVLQIGDGSSDSGLLGTGPVTNWGALVIARGGNSVFPSVISGTGSLTNSTLDLGSGAATTLTGSNTYTGPTVVTLGTLLVGTASQSPTPYTVMAGAGFGTVVGNPGGTLTINSLSFGSFGCTLNLNLGSFGNPTGTVITDTGNVTVDGDVTVNVSGKNISVGTITLFEYGSRSGSGSFVLGTLPDRVTGATLNDDTANKRVTLTITTTFDPTLRYVGDTQGVWDVANTANQIWQEVGSGQTTNYYESTGPDGYPLGPPVRFDDSATGTTVIDVSTLVYPDGITVSNSLMPYTFSTAAPGSTAIAGSGGLTKLGANTLTFAFDELPGYEYTGLTRILEGTLVVGDGSTGTIGTGGVTNNGTLVVNHTNAVTIAGDITGPGRLIVMGAGLSNTVVTLSPATNSLYSGGTITTNATIQMGNGVANSLGNDGTGLGTGTNTFWGDCELDMFDSGNNGGNNGYDFNPIIDVPAGQTLTYNLAGRCREASTLIGSGTINVRARWVRCYAVGDWSQFAGQINFYSASGLTSLRLNDTLGMPLAKVHLADPDGLGNVVRLMNQGTGELFYPIGELSGEPATFIEGENGDGSDPPASTVWVVGGLNTDATFAGTTADSLQNNATNSFVKVGTGTWTLSGTNLHSGFTTVSNGVLALVADAGLSNSVTITAADPGILDVSGRTDGTLWLGTSTSAQTLAGNGTVKGDVVLGPNATLAPGFSVGTLTVTSGSITLGGTTVLEVTTSGSPASDQLVAPNITYGGTLILTNIGSISGSHVFQLFSGSLSGSFDNVITQALSGVTWDLSKLNTDGTVTVVGSAVDTTPTNIVFQVSGNQLTLSWPSSHVGWRLQVQTNSLSTGLTSDWVDVAGSTATNEMSFAVAPGQGVVFYRLVYP